MKKITASYLQDNILADSVGRKKDGTFVARQGYFYRAGKNAKGFCASVEADLKELGLNYEIIEIGDHWTPFRGGASLAQSSHFFVHFKINQIENPER